MEYLVRMNAKALLLLAPLLFLLALLSSCGECSRKIDCPGFADDTLTRLFPYTDNQRLVFRSDTAGQKIFTLKNTITTQPYQATSGAYGPGPSCVEEKVFASAETDSFSRSLFGVVLQSGDYRKVNVTISTASISFDNFSDTAFSTVIINGYYARPVFHPLITVGNRTFANALTAARDTFNNKQPGIYRIVYTRAEGLVGYTDYPSGVNWVKQ